MAVSGIFGVKILSTAYSKEQVGYNTDVGSNQGIIPNTYTRFKFTLQEIFIET
jgi:hypothetical protein